MKTIRNKKRKQTNTHHRNYSFSCSPNKLVTTLLEMRVFIQLHHWRTTDFSIHKATDQLFTSMGEQIDSFMETMLGKPEFSNRSSILRISSLSIPSKKPIKNQIETYKHFFMQCSLFTNKKHADLANIRDEIVGGLNQFLYLLTLH